MRSLRSSVTRSSCKTGGWFKSLQSSSIHITWTTLGFQYSIFYPVAGDSYPSVVIPDLERKLAHGLPNLSKQLGSRLRNGSSTAGLAHLANHTCCPHHRNSVLQILSIWQEDRTSAILKGPAGDGPGARNSKAPGRIVASPELPSSFGKARLSSPAIETRSRQEPQPN